MTELVFVKPVTEDEDFLYHQLKHWNLESVQLPRSVAEDLGYEQCDWCLMPEKLRVIARSMKRTLSMKFPDGLCEEEIIHFVDELEAAGLFIVEEEVTR